MSICWDLYNVFMRVDWGYVLWRKIMEVKHHFQHVISSVHTINMTCHYWYWPWSPNRNDFCQISPLDKKLERGIPGWLSGWASAFSPGPDPGVPGSSPASGSLHGACFSLCLCLCLSLSLCVTIIKKKKKMLKCPMPQKIYVRWELIQEDKWI